VGYVARHRHCRARVGRCGRNQVATSQVQQLRKRKASWAVRAVTGGGAERAVLDAVNLGPPCSPRSTSQLNHEIGTVHLQPSHVRCSPTACVACSGVTLVTRSRGQKSQDECKGVGPRRVDPDGKSSITITTSDGINKTSISLLTSCRLQDVCVSLPAAIVKCGEAGTGSLGSAEKPPLLPPHSTTSPIPDSGLHTSCISLAMRCCLKVNSVDIAMTSYYTRTVAIRRSRLHDRVLWRRTAS